MLISICRFRASLTFSLFFLVSSQINAQQSDIATRIYSQASKSVVLIVTRSGSDLVAQGTGFLVADGKVITNEHVVRSGSPFIDVGGARIPAKVEAVDAVNDLAVLTTAAEMSAEPLTLAVNTPPPGTNVYTIGNPQGLEKSISTGVVAGVREASGRQLIQITTPISPGSSGGPVLDSTGAVIGVTVGSLTEGQNLNFAVPASAVRQLLVGGAGPLDAAGLVQRAEALIKQRGDLEWSSDPDSPYQKMQAQISTALSGAVERSGSDFDMLLRISRQFADEDLDIAIAAAENALRLKPSSPEASLALSTALDVKGIWSDEPEKKTLLARSEKAARSAIASSRTPTPEMYYALGDVLGDEASYVEADTILRRALTLASDTSFEIKTVRRLVQVDGDAGRVDDSEDWFKLLGSLGAVNAWDWSQRGQRLDAAKRYLEAGESWQTAATGTKVWTQWCEAAGSYLYAGGQDDSVLACARQCIAGGAGKADSEPRLGEAHKEISEVLSNRGVFEEALSHAREATALLPEDPWAYDELAAALLGLHRYQEAINAAKQAVRLADGKYSTMHFHLGNAYFGTENWVFAQQSFEKAAELAPKDPSSAYNAALSMQRQGLYLDAAHWYEEVLRRDPQRSDRQEILDMIKTLRGR